VTVSVPVGASSAKQVGAAKSRLSAALRTRIDFERVAGSIGRRVIENLFVSGSVMSMFYRLEKRRAV
jgi:hypothetical protein